MTIIIVTNSPLTFFMAIKQERQSGHQKIVSYMERRGKNGSFLPLMPDEPVNTASAYFGWKLRPMFHFLDLRKKHRGVNGLPQSHCELIAKPATQYKIIASRRIKTFYAELGRNSRVCYFQANHQTVNTDPFLHVLKIITVMSRYRILHLLPWQRSKI